MRIKNWRKFQHYRDRSPEWIKLYNGLLNDPEWFKLSGDDSKILVMLWLLASEDETLSGVLPEAETICFRLRIKEKELNQYLTRLSAWLEQDASTPLADCYQDASLEREIEIETEIETDGHFETFWDSYPRKVGKKAAEREFKKAAKETDPRDILAALESQKADWRDPKYIPHPRTWLSQGRYLDAKPTLSRIPTFPHFSDSENWRAWEAEYRQTGNLVMLRELKQRALEGRAFGFPADFPPQKRMAENA